MQSAQMKLPTTLSCMSDLVASIRQMYVWPQFLLTKQEHWFSSGQWVFQPHIQKTVPWIHSAI